MKAVPIEGWAQIVLAVSALEVRILRYYLISHTITSHRRARAIAGRVGEADVQWSIRFLIIVSAC